MLPSPVRSSAVLQRRLLTEYRTHRAAGPHRRQLLFATVFGSRRASMCRPPAPRSLKCCQREIWRERHFTNGRRARGRRRGWRRGGACAQGAMRAWASARRASRRRGGAGRRHHVQHELLELANVELAVSIGVKLAEQAAEVGATSSSRSPTDGGAP